MITAFRALHDSPEPLVLDNAWDVGSALAVARAGAPAIATGSWAVAASRGLEDAERVPLDAVLALAAAIVERVAVPVTVDIESGFAEVPDGVGETVARLAATGAAGCNLEDGVPGEGRVRDESDAVARVAAARSSAELFINARFDGFLLSPAERHAGLVDEAIERGRAYAAAGADGFFVPGLAEPSALRRIVDAVPVPVNAMAVDVAADLGPLAGAGVRRISRGPGLYLHALAAIERAVAR
ncbi:isocitrate lyase/phosphoenolpyruvate mutase family protein [Agrococcus sp. HG114]|uniref:isocitrate lyase/PEP mutase family protein n=1 Tax=Agrococcus sp. HG114 TaxID=2969757 RepID=UPI00215AEFDB|nr:isocitrate lyase/phosphoenolpyruvate mutase family protein [Agrococcus sp. HG114]MCR8670295.1 isocitrate lyase/phosphoenolpyruvate mutase family protein [Agrococcus sp. HG114]